MAELMMGQRNAIRRMRVCSTTIRRIVWTCLLGVIAFSLLSCAQSPTRANSTATATPTSVPRGGYTDTKLGYSLRLPDGWGATAYPGWRGSSHNDALVLRDPINPAALITLGVIHGPTMPAAFAVRGTPTTHVGSYPAFAADTTTHQGRVPCVVRIFLAGSDYALGEWCSMDAAIHAAALEELLATYRTAPPGFAPSATPIPPPGPQTCAGAQRSLGYAASVSWGRTLAAPGATGPSGGWGGLAPGIYLCSNTNSPDQYLFQCTELVNRYDLEALGLGHIPGSAARYFDYYQDGVPHPGDVRDLPPGTYATSDDAYQGTSAFAPRPGDLLVFQDVANPRAGWRSGLIGSPGHIALITAVGAGHVYIAQENYNDQHYFLALPLATLPNGYHVTDSSGIANRIVRGWVRLIP
jgi:hypothetical protein